MSTSESPAPRLGRATMRDVAALAGVSLKTVSRVVNRRGRRVRRPARNGSSGPSDDWTTATTWPRATSAAATGGPESSAPGPGREQQLLGRSASQPRGRRARAPVRRPGREHRRGDRPRARARRRPRRPAGRRSDPHAVDAATSPTSPRRSAPASPAVFVDRPPRGVDADSVARRQPRGAPERRSRTCWPAGIPASPRSST